MKRSNKGITMIEIVIVIIILILLAVIAIWNTWASYNKAEGTNVLGEFQSVESGAIMLKTFYDNDESFELRQFEHYCEKVVDDSGDTWYVIYGRDDDGVMWYNNLTDGEEVYKTILDNWGLDNLNRSYEIKFDRRSVEIKFANNNYVEVNKFKVYSYEDIKTLLESGAF